MGKAKKKARAAPRAAKAAPPPPMQTPGRLFATIRNVTLPVMSCRIGEPVYVTFLEEMRDHGESGPAAFARVKELTRGEVQDFAIAAGLAGILASHYPGKAYVEKSFCIVRHAKHDRKNESGYSVEEIDPAQKVEPALTPA